MASSIPPRRVGMHFHDTLPLIVSFLVALFFLLHASRTSQAGCVAEIVPPETIALDPAASYADAPTPSDALLHLVDHTPQLGWPPGTSTLHLTTFALRIPFQPLAVVINNVQARRDRFQRRHTPTRSERRIQTAITRQLVRSQWINTRSQHEPTG
jgi:hypothetical protein